MAGVNTLFGAMELADGAKKVKSSYVNANNNKYDNILGTKIDKSIPMIKNNSLISKGQVETKLASQQLDMMCKEANFATNGAKKAIKFVNNGTKKAIKFVGDNAGNMGTKLSDLDAKNSQHIKGVVNGFKNKSINEITSNGLSAAKVTIPAAAGMVGAGVGTSKAFKKLDKKRTPESDVEYNTIGAGVTSALALAALSNKRMLKPGVIALKTMGAKAMKVPANSLKKNSKAAKFVVDALGSSTKQVNNVIKNEANQINNLGSSIIKAMKNEKNPLGKDAAIDLVKKRKISDFETLLKAQGKGADEITKLVGEETARLNTMISSAASRIKDEDTVNTVVNKVTTKKASDELLYLEKIAGSKTQYAKKLVVDHLFKRGLESVPYYAAPAAVGFALDRDLRNGLKKNKHKECEVEKVAFQIPSSPNVKNTVKVGLEKSMEGIGRTFIPATITAVTGRNVMNSFEKLNDSRDNTRQEDMANKIIIQINGETGKRAMKKEISQKLDAALQKKAAVDDTSYDVSNILENVTKKINTNITGSEKLKSKKIHIGNGVKKVFRSYK